MINIINIIICCDNDTYRNKYEKVINDEINYGRLNMRISLSTSNEKEVLNYVKDNKEKKFLYFFDMESENHMNSIELARKIRNYDLRGYIVIISSYEELSFLTFKYKIQVMDYIIKGNGKDIRKNIIECLHSSIEKVGQLEIDKNKKEESILISEGNKIKELNFKDIIYIETSQNHRITLHCIEEDINFFGTIKEIEESLSKDFYKVHRSCIINLKAIKEIDKSEKAIYMSNNRKVYSSRNCFSELLEKYKMNIM